MAKEELIQFEGLVTEILPDARYRVQLDAGHEIVAYTAGKMKKNRIKTLAGDRVTIEIRLDEQGRIAEQEMPVRFADGARSLLAAGARTFASLYSIESFARATVASVIPIQAYEILRSEQTVSILYTLVSLLGLSATLFMPIFIRRFARRWVYTAGVCLHAVVSLFFVLHDLPGQFLGMLCRVMGCSALSITHDMASARKIADRIAMIYRGRIVWDGAADTRVFVWASGA